jgi:hypothetical protein
MLENACLFCNIGMLQIILHSIKTPPKKALDKTITTFKITWVKNPFTISHGKKGPHGSEIS